MPGPFHLYPFQAGMRVRLKKKHPCGGDVWLIERVGAEAALRCQTCKRLLIMKRRQLEQATRELVAD